MITLTTVAYGTVTLSSHPQDARFLCWRNDAGKRVSQYAPTVAGAWKLIKHRVI